ncbi:MAG: hypothetical protein HN945_18180 [Deltaproteobacteria bacterium]|nr:hypothetical protein [Deltaproteobacteria bacterium]MBT7713947.1 hypothetical protein [Deltaproteobacteria bacterium]
MYENSPKVILIIGNQWLGSLFSGKEIPYKNHLTKAGMKAASRLRTITGFPIIFKKEKIPLWMIYLTKIIKAFILTSRWLFKKQRNENEIIAACNCLDVGEYQLFELAYRDWYGKAADIKNLTRCFANYLNGDQAPFWVYHYARKILKLHQIRELNPNDAKYHHYDCDYKSPVSKTTGVVIVFAVLIVIVAFDFMLILI